MDRDDCGFCHTAQSSLSSFAFAFKAHQDRGACNWALSRSKHSKATRGVHTMDWI